ncbi:hypothetical protein WA026_007689 [Henosepilachna vigintioctopunctata]|uniref:Uncharacterized protein n=1 Tax=Henosepilachna vigintioctopunctata TaxID=420089 RepID=A0AAW1TUS2_9CUCU
MYYHVVTAVSIRTMDQWMNNELFPIDPVNTHCDLSGRTQQFFFRLIEDGTAESKGDDIWHSMFALPLRIRRNYEVDGSANSITEVRKTITGPQSERHSHIGPESACVTL